jgi:phosphatidylinositol-3-phosphatase
MMREERVARVAILLGAIGVLIVGGIGVSRSLIPGASCGRETVPLGDSLAGPATAPRPTVRHVIVVAMENTPAEKVYKGSTPYLHTVVSRGAHTKNFRDPLRPGVLSEPHYIWMEAGTNTFDDTKFCRDPAPSAANSTASTDHLVSRMDAAVPPITWMSYQEGLDPKTTGACPIHAAGNYAPKHDPFVFFQDVVGNPPSATNAKCAAHHRPARQLASDVSNDDLADYVFVTPDLCHDMHDRCGSNRIANGDAWLQTNLPAILDYAGANDSVVFLVWDEGSETDSVLPFYAFGPSVKAGYEGAVTYTHSSMLRSVETMFGLPLLASVKQANDLSDLFRGNVLPRHTP